MKSFLRQRKSRCAICLLAIVAATAFLQWDASRLSGKEAAWIPSPQYLVIWFGAVVTGAVATLGLILDGLSAMLRGRRSTAISEGAQPEEAPAVHLLSQF